VSVEGFYLAAPTAGRIQVGNQEFATQQHADGAPPVAAEVASAQLAVVTATVAPGRTLAVERVEMRERAVPDVSNPPPSQRPPVERAPARPERPSFTHPGAPPGGSPGGPPFTPPHGPPDQPPGNPGCGTPPCGGPPISPPGGGPPNAPPGGGPPCGTPPCGGAPSGKPAKPQPGIPRGRPDTGH
jgi:hypothetical protein